MNSKTSGLRDQLYFTSLLIRESFRTFSQNNNLQMAATLAYYGFFSLIPLLLLVVIILGHLTESNDKVLVVIESLASKAMPSFNEIIVKELHALSTQKIWGFFTIVLLVWILTPFTSAIRTAFNQVFRVENDTGLLKDNILNLLAALALLLLFVLLIVGKMTYAYLTSTLDEQYEWLSVLQFGLTVFSSVVFLSFFYLVFSPVRLSWWHVLVGSSVASLLLFIINPVFATILQFNPNYGFAFGSLKAIFLLTVWVFYAFAVILAGSEVIANLRREEALFMKRLFAHPADGAFKVPGLLRKYTRSYSVGEVICKEGDEGSEMFYILSGAVEIKKGEEQIATLDERKYFGEMSMLLGERRSATVKVLEPDTELVIISQQNFETILRDNPKIVHLLLQEMAERVKVTTSRVG